MLNPNFPYSNDQVIISSGGIIAHSKRDTIMLFGKTGVGVSTNAGFHVDALEGTYINSNLIELGLRASKEGYRVVKGEVLIRQLNRLLDDFDNLGNIMNEVAKSTNTGTDFHNLAVMFASIGNTARSIKTQLSLNSLSETTFTL